MAATTSQRIIDADVHHQYPSGSALAKYMPDGDPAPYYTIGGAISSPHGAYRRDSIPPGGGSPGSDPEWMVEHHLDHYGLDYAILNPGSTLGLGGFPDYDFAAARARATNDWTINEWFPVDERFLGSILVGPRDPEQAADEIRRLGDHPRMVQATLTSAPCLLGDEFMHPIYEACNEFGLPLTMHVGGGESGLNPGSYNVGAPTTFTEYHVGMCVPAIHHLISMVMSGVFVKYPRIKLVLNEFGFAWLPFAMWRLDMEFRGGRRDNPWLTKLPSHYMREFVRFTTQPLEVPENPQDLVTLISILGAEDMLMFSSDYPHWDFDDPRYALKGFPDDWKERIYYGTAAETFRIAERLAAPEAAASV